MAENTLLEEKKELSLEELDEKIKRLDLYINRVQSLVARNKKKMDKIEEIERKALFKMKIGLVRGKVYG